MLFESELLDLQTIQPTDLNCYTLRVPADTLLQIFSTYIYILYDDSTLWLYLKLYLLLNSILSNVFFIWSFKLDYLPPGYIYIWMRLGRMVHINILYYSSYLLSILNIHYL